LQNIPNSANCIAHQFTFSMPTYEYECAKCRKTFDAFQSMKDDAYKTCPEDLCQMKKWGKGKVKRLLGTGAGLLFKGSGFYITDYRSDSYKQSAKSESSSGSKESGSQNKSGQKSKDSTKSAASKPKSPGST